MSGIYQYSWEDWTDVMKDCHRVLITRHIYYLKWIEGREIEVKVETRHATLDELAASKVYLDTEIDRLTKISLGIHEIQKRVHREVRSGLTRVVEALGLADHESELPDTLGKVL